MLAEEIKRRVENATVTITKRGGQGTVIPGGYILTAAHVIDYQTEEFGTVFLSNSYVEEIETVNGVYRTGPVIVEPVNDIAVLGALDGESFFDDYETYQAFYESVEPISLAVYNDKDFDSDGVINTDAFIYTHEIKWITVKATLFNNFPSQWPGIWIESEEPIKGGTSGSAIINCKGEIIGVVSTASESPTYNGIQPRACTALPVWIFRAIMEG